MFSELHLGQNSILSGNNRAFTDDLEPFIDTPDLSDPVFESCRKMIFMSSSLILKMVDKPAGAKDVPRCRLKEFNGSGYRRRTIMDNNDQTVTKLGRT